MEDLAVEEAKLLIKNYSEARRNSKKWKQLTRFGPANSPIQISVEHGETLILISRSSHTIEVYPKKSLQKRGQIRRNIILLYTIFDLWNIINPFHYSGISEKVYKKVYYMFYSTLFPDGAVDKIIENLVENDIRVDFGNRICMGFAEFYDGFFEFLDNNTRSTLASEYIHFASQLLRLANELDWNNGVNLYSKTHLDTIKGPSYWPWMVKIFKSNKEKSANIPKMLTEPTDVHVSERLLTRKPFKPVDKENFNIRKLEKIMSERLVKKFRPETLRKNSQMLRKTKSQDKKAVTFYSNYIDKINPLSPMIKTTRSRQNILECVIDGRKMLKQQGKLNDL